MSLIVLPEETLKTGCVYQKKKKPYSKQTVMADKLKKIHPGTIGDIIAVGIIVILILVFFIF